MKPFLIPLLTLVLCSGCFPNNNTSYRPSAEWVAVDGNKAGATVKLACTYDVYLQSVGSFSSAQKIAKTKCREWGYGTAKAFGGGQERCADLQCGVKIYEVVFQCIGEKQKYDIEQEKKRKEKAAKEEYYKTHPEERPSIFKRFHEINSGEE